MQFSTKRFFILILFFATQLQANNNPAARQLTEQEILLQEQKIAALILQLEKQDQKNNSFKKKEAIHDFDSLKVGITNVITPMSETDAQLMIDCAPAEVKLIIDDCIKAAEMKSKVSSENDEKRRLVLLPNVIVLVGPPGTGKSELALAMAHKIKRPGYIIESSQLGTKYKNSDSENLLNEIKFIEGLDQECLVILEELPVLLNKNQYRTDIDPAPAFWRKLDENSKTGKKILYVITANDINQLPAPLLSRLESETIKVALPDENSRKKALLNYLEGDLDISTIKYLAKVTEGFSFRSIAALSNKILKIKIRGAETISIGTCKEIIEDMKSKKELDYRAWDQIPWGQKTYEQCVWQSFKDGSEYGSRINVIGLVIGLGNATKTFVEIGYKEFKKLSNDETAQLAALGVVTLPVAVSAGSGIYVAANSAYIFYAAGVPLVKAAAAGAALTVSGGSIGTTVGITALATSGTAAASPAVLGAIIATKAAAATVATTAMVAFPVTVAVAGGSYIVYWYFWSKPKPKSE